MNQKSSALYEVLEFPSRLIALIESTLIAPENNNDGCIDLLAFVAQRGIYGEITERNLFAEEGRVLDRLKRGPIKSEYLGIVVDELRKQVSRGKSIPQQLTDLTLSLCQYLVKCAAAGATAEAVDAHLERIGQEKTARRAAVNKLREHIAPLGLTVTNAKETKRYTIVEDGT